jgi:hypothetical protein
MGLLNLTKLSKYFADLNNSSPKQEQNSHTGEKALPKGRSREILTSADQITEEQESYSRKALNLLPLVHFGMSSLSNSRPHK